MAVLSAEQVEAVWQAAAVVPQALLDADTRAGAARQLFDARRSAELARAAREATTIVRTAERLVAASPYRTAMAQIAACRHPDGKGGWLALPAMSASLALVARIARSFGEALDATLERVAGCDCGEETSCYGCLRGYRNQPFHEELRRGVAVSFLRPLVPARMIRH